MVVQVDDGDGPRESPFPQDGDGDRNVVVDAEPCARLGLRVMKASTDVERYSLVPAECPGRRFERTSDLPPLRRQHRIDVHIGCLEAEDAPEVLRLGRPLQIVMRVRLTEVLQTHDRGGPDLLRAYEAFDRKRAENLFAPIDFDARHACRLPEFLDAIARMVPEPNAVSEPSMCFATLEPSGHGAYIEIEPLRNSVFAMCTLMTTGVPAAERALASSSTASTRAGSSSSRPAAP